jgi:starch phosphorylase
MDQFNAKGIYTEQEVKDILESKISRYFGVCPEEATKTQVYKAVILTVKDMLTEKRSAYRRLMKRDSAKRVYYMCMEFLIGPSLKNNLRNLEIEEAYAAAVKALGYDINELYEAEPNPGLGNGGLGRLAACFMDSLTTLDYPATGYSLLYEYGLFKQKIIDGEQVELEDIWMPGAEGWLVPRTDKAFPVRFGGRVTEEWQSGRLVVNHVDYEEVQAIPYDMMISGYQNAAVNNLRLWKAQSAKSFNMTAFTQGQYVQAVEKSNSAETLTKVLYPSDEHMEGKILRLSQQYLLVSASLQNIIADHLAQYGTLANFGEKNSIHINDTHPALCIPELMRIFMDVYSFSWEAAWDTVIKVVSYTNHTVMPEALECWNEDLFRLRLPRIHNIVCEINRRFCENLWNLYPGDWDRISRMSIIGNGQVRMANLSVVGSHTVNGVSKLHSDILKETVFHDFYKATPDKFTNVTNGIAHRRWLCYSNPGLANLLDETIGDGYRKNPEQLAEFSAYAEDPKVIDAVRAIKRQNKESFAQWFCGRTGGKIDTHSVFDVQVKRIHEYKRQLLNVLKIVALYDEIKNNPNADITPQTFIFGGKAASGYYMAKNIVRLIWNLGQEIEKDPAVRDKIRVIFLEDYNVSTAEILMPATDISEQISLAGKEASGTGCMKFMINGAMTVGTLDGANVEMASAVGKDNIYIFGLTAKEVEELWKSGYSAMSYYANNPRIKAVIDRINGGFNGVDFSHIAKYLVTGNYSVPDPYMCLADFESYTRTYHKALGDYADRNAWTTKAIHNIAGAGYFAADRSICEYASNIWKVKSVTE